MKHGVLLLIFAVVIIPIIGYGLMHLLVYVMPMSGGIGPALLYTVIAITLGLGVPYAMLKLGFHAAHLNNEDEKEFTLKDIPKDKDQLAKY